MRHASVAGLANSIYGTVLTIALIAAYSADESLDALFIAAGVVVTTAVFWLAHAQAELLALRYTLGHRPTGGERREQVRESLPMVEASFPPALALVLGDVAGFSNDTSVAVALGIGVAELAGWGVAIGRREQLGALRVAAVTALNVALGLAVVALKLVIH